MPRYFFEDFKIGDRWEFGSWTPTKDEIVAFAEHWDPQPIHIDEAAAADSPFGGLIASGWQTTMECARLFIGQLMRHTAGLASPGLEDIRWHKPVRPGDEITSTAEVYFVEESKSRPDRGKVGIAISGLDATGQPVMTTRGIFFIKKRDG